MQARYRSKRERKIIRGILLIFSTWLRLRIVFSGKRMQDAPQNVKYVSKSTQTELLHAAAKVLKGSLTK